MAQPVSVPRGRHAPPLEVRLEAQRERLFEAATAAFARLGYAEASAEAISREAGMSKATFYEHFANKEECMLALVSHAGQEVLGRMLEAARVPADWRERHMAGARAFLDYAAAHPDLARVTLVEVVGAGPRALEHRDAMFDAIAEGMYQDTEQAAHRSGSPRFHSKEDAYACVGAIYELTSRHIRHGRPPRVGDLEPVIDRLVLGVISQSGR